MANSIVLEKLPVELPTAYVLGGVEGGTRTRTGDIPHISQVLSVGRTGSKNWRLAPGAARDWVLLNNKWCEMGGEPLRLVDGHRPPQIAERTRDGYELWLAADQPSPGSPRWRRGMKTSYVARADETNHQWGGAVDFDVMALFMNGLPRGSDDALQKLWTVMGLYGWFPVIRYAIAEQSEAWHIDHHDALTPVYEELRKKHRAAYAETARIGCALAGQLAPATTRRQERYIQARLSIAGFPCGIADGFIGRKTKAALTKAGCPKDIRDGSKRRPDDVVNWMNDDHIGEEQIASL